MSKNVSHVVELVQFLKVAPRYLFPVTLYLYQFENLLQDVSFHAKRAVLL